MARLRVHRRKRELPEGLTVALDRDRQPTPVEEPKPGEVTVTVNGQP